MEKAIKNIKVYNERMEKGMNEKLYFLEGLAKDSVVLDYGCANGALGQAIHLLRPDIIYIGYDKSAEMVELASKNYPYGFYSSDFNMALRSALDYKRYKSRDVALVLSSVIHEVYSYANDSLDIDIFWKQVFNSEFSYIFIRDMALENDEIAYSSVPHVADIIKYHIEFNHLDLPEINNFKDYYQLWLKYWYVENWDREVNEDYFPITLEQLKLKIKHQGSNYTITYEEHNVNDYVEKKVIDEFWFNPFIFNTHYRMILKLNKK